MNKKELIARLEAKHEELDREVHNLHLAIVEVREQLALKANTRRKGAASKEKA